MDKGLKGVNCFDEKGLLGYGIGRTNFGPLNILTGYAFLNYCTIMFFFCVGLMIVVSVMTGKPRTEQITDLTFSHKTMSAGVEKTWVWVQVILSILVMSIMISIWVHFA